MTTPSESETLTRVGPGTRMGDLMRQYWIPAALSSELEADGAPVRLLLLGEKLLAFRDSSGRVGIMDHRCPHRCASLFFGRNEADGLRCVYHGWKFDAEGNCVDMPNVPTHQDFRHKVKAKAYHVAERNGLVWVHMSDRETAPPPLPALEAASLPEAEVSISFSQRECNWLQALEGDIDTSHFSFLHFGAVEPDDIEVDEMARTIVVDRAPQYRVADTDWGLMYGAYRESQPGMDYWRIAQYLFPFWTMPPHGAMDDHIWTRGWVPMDDTHTMFVELSWNARSPGLRGRKDGTPVPGLRPGSGHLPNGTGWTERWRLAANAGNDYLIDRARQKDDLYTGIEGIYLQDQAVTESMGDIVDHGFERLAPSDQMITQTRRRLLRAAAALAEDGTPPPCAANPAIYAAARAGDILAERDADWIAAFEKNFAALTNRVSPAEAAE